MGNKANSPSGAPSLGHVRLETIIELHPIAVPAPMIDSTLVKTLLSECDSLDFRMMAEQAQDGRWLLMQLRVEAMTGGHEHSKPPTVEGLLLSQANLPIEEFGALLTAVKKGVLPIEGNEVSLAEAFGSHERWDLKSLGNRWTQRGTDWATLTFGESVRTPSNMRYSREVLEGALRCADPPFAGMEDLKEELFREVPQSWGNTRDGRIEFIVPLGARFDHLQLDERRLDISTSLRPGADSDHAAIGVIADLGEGRPLRRRLEGNGGSLTFPKAPIEVSAYLTYRGLSVDERTVQGKFPEPQGRRAAVWGHLLAEPRNLSDGLSLLADGLKERGGKKMEAWVALLCNLSGLSATDADPIEKNSADVVAFPYNDAWTLLIECTSRDPANEDKLSKLAMRAKRLRHATETPVLPVLMTQSDPKTWTAGAKTRAREEGIALLGPADIDAWLRLALQGLDAAGLKELLQERVPPVVHSMGQGGILKSTWSKRQGDWETTR